MAIFGLAPETIKPVALMLTILVASLRFWQFSRAGHLSWSLFWSFALLSVPAAFAGGALNLPAHAFRAAVGVILLLSWPGASSSWYRNARTGACPD